MVVGLPSGTVTFLFTDIEGSTSLWEKARDSMRLALERHDAILCDSIRSHGGQVFSTGGDGLAAVFARSMDAISAAARAQEALTAEAQSTEESVREMERFMEFEEMAGPRLPPQGTRAR